MTHFRGTFLNWSFNPKDFTDFTKTVWPQVDGVPGFLSKEEAFFLYMAARTAKGGERKIDQPFGGTVVEIGSYKGRSSVALGMGLRANVEHRLELYCVDPFFDNQIEPGLKEEFQHNISENDLADIVTCLPKYSEDAAKQWPLHKGIALLFIDGNHEYEFVRDDFLTWSRFVVPGGMIVFHDWYLVGVQEALYQYLFPRKEMQDVAFVDGNMVAVRKVDRPPDARQSSMKKRMYWALRTGSDSPWLAAMKMLYGWLSNPFGSIHRFFTIRIVARHTDANP